MSNTFFQSPEINKGRNVDVKTKQLLNGRPVYFRYVFQDTFRIDTSSRTLISEVNDVMDFNLKFQATTGGEINFLPYVHTDNSKVYFNLSGTNLRIIANGSYKGNYKIWGWIKYTKSTDQAIGS